MGEDAVEERHIGPQWKCVVRAEWPRYDYYFRRDDEPWRFYGAKDKLLDWRALAAEGVMRQEEEA